MACHPTAFDLYKSDDVRYISIRNASTHVPFQTFFSIRMCTSITSRDFYIVHHEMGHIQHYLQYHQQPFWFRRSPHGAFSEGIGDAIALATMSPAHLKRIGLLENYKFTKGN